MLLNNCCLRENNYITSNKLRKKENFKHSDKFRISKLLLCKYKLIFKSIYDFYRIYLFVFNCFFFLVYVFFAGV